MRTASSSAPRPRPCSTTASRADYWPANNRIKVGADTAFLLRPSYPLDISVGVEAHHAIMLDPEVDYVFYLRTGDRESG